jgi:hypothetical protein
MPHTHTLTQNFLSARCEYPYWDTLPLMSQNLYSSYHSSSALYSPHKFLGWNRSSIGISRFSKCLEFYMRLTYFLDSHLRLFQLTLEIGSCLCGSEKKLIKCSTQVIRLTTCNILLVIDVNPVNSLTRLKSIHRHFRLSCFPSKLHVQPIITSMILFTVTVNFLYMVLKMAIFQQVSIWNFCMHLSSKYEVHQRSMKFSKNTGVTSKS